MNEFKLELGSLTEALKSAALAVVLFIIAPLLVLIFLGSFLNAFSSNSVIYLAQLITDYRSAVIVIGVVLTVVAALKGFYPKGSYSRLTFNLAMIPLYLLLVWSFDMGGRMGPAFVGAGFPIDLGLVLWLFTLFIVFVSFYKLAEFIDFRRQFLEGLSRRYPGVKVPRLRPAEDPDKHKLWQDFRPRYGRFLPGMSEANAALLKFVIFPLLIIILLGGMIESTQGMLTNGAANGLFDFGSATLIRLSALLLIVGLPIAVISFFKGFYPKGSVSRLTFALIITALICLWIYFAALGGHISVAMEMFNNPLNFNVNFEPLLWLFIIAAALWGIYWAVEALIYRRDWKENGFYPVNDAVLKERRKHRKAMEQAREEEERRQAAERMSPSQNTPVQQSGQQQSQPSPSPPDEVQPPQGPNQVP